MTAAEGRPAPPAPLHVDRAGPGDDRADPEPGTLPALCPFLATPEGTWRSARAVGDHRCMAVSPPVPLAAEKQRRLCLVDAHVGCATYGAAMAARSVSSARHAGQTRPVARMTPVILDHGRFDLRVPALHNDRASQAILIGLLGVAFTAVLLARPSDSRGVLSPGGSGSPAPSGSAVPAAPAAGGTTRPSSAATAEPAASADPSTEPTEPSASGAVAPTPSSATPAPTLSGETYRVASGDTLIAIAARFGTTSQVLAELNDIADPSRLKIGQTLILP